MQVVLIKRICSRMFIRELFEFSHLYFASVCAAERQHFSARAA